MKKESKLQLLGSLASKLQSLEDIIRSKVITKNLYSLLKMVEMVERDPIKIETVTNFLEKRLNNHFPNRAIKVLENKLEREILDDLEKQKLKKQIISVKRSYKLITKIKNDDLLTFNYTPFFDFIIGYDNLSENKKFLLNGDGESWIERWHSYPYLKENPNNFVVFCLGRYYSLMSMKQIDKLTETILLRKSTSWYKNLNFSKLLKIFAEITKAGALISLNESKEKEKEENSNESSKEHNLIPFRRFRQFIEYYLLTEYFENNNQGFDQNINTFLFGAGFFLQKKPEKVDLKISTILEMVKWDKPNQIAGFLLGKLFSIYSYSEFEDLNTRSYKKLAKKIQLAEIGNHPEIMSYIFMIAFRILAKKDAKMEKETKGTNKNHWLYTNVKYLSHIEYYMKLVIKNDLLENMNDKYEDALTFMTGYQYYKKSDEND